ncbi:MAG: hypothetical protein ACT4TC_24455 [Myxococcaceae bacterium]
METKKVGAEVDAFCTKCRMTLAHTILAMVGSKIARVKCNTCMGEHVYRTEGGSTPSARAASSKARTSRAEKAEKVVITFDQRLAGKDLKAAPKYSPKDTYTIDQIVNHPTFGIGIVTGVRGEKVDLAFKGDSKTLIHGRAGSPAAKPAFVPPNAKNSGPADKQPPAENSARASAPQTE